MKIACNTMALAAAIVLLSLQSGRAQEEDELDPLGGVIADMQVAGGRLAKKLTDKPTQLKQKEAVEKLDALIKLLEERRGQQGSQVNPNPEKPAEESTIRTGPGGSGPLHAARRNGNAWGQLPAHKREQILQSMTEGFPAHYQPILERYFQRLAEERPVGEGPEAAGPASAKPPAAGAPAPAMDRNPAEKSSASKNPPAEKGTP
jgi:hypothetical protein